MSENKILSQIEAEVSLFIEISKTAAAIGVIYNADDNRISPKEMIDYLRNCSIMQTENILNATENLNSQIHLAISTSTNDDDCINLIKIKLSSLTGDMYYLGMNTTSHNCDLILHRLIFLLNFIEDCTVQFDREMISSLVKAGSVAFGCFRKLSDSGYFEIAINCILTFLVQRCNFSNEYQKYRIIQMILLSGLKIAKDSCIFLKPDVFNHIDQPLTKFCEHLVSKAKLESLNDSDPIEVISLLLQLRQYLKPDSLEYIGSQMIEVAFNQENESPYFISHALKTILKKYFMK